MRKLAAVAALACAVLAGTAVAATYRMNDAVPSAMLQPISFGVADDTGKFAADGGAWFDAQLRGANLSEERWAVGWDPGNPTMIDDLPFLLTAAPQAQADGVKVVLALYSKSASRHNPKQFCGWAASVAASVQQWGIGNFIIGNEPNIRTFWVPQKDGAGRDVAAPAYEALLASCYDAIKHVNPQARVIGMGLSPHATSQSNHPLVFLRDVGRAYRASGRTEPIMDQLAVHPYPNPASPADAPWIGYRNPDDFGIPNLDRVKQALWDAFNGTAQPTTVNGLTLRVDEVGWQVSTTGLAQYFGRETVPTVTPAKQAVYLRTMIEDYLACDPSVTDVLLFHLIDEKYRGSRDEHGGYAGGGWQSGLETYGGPGLSEPRGGYTAVAADALAGRAACANGFSSWKPNAARERPIPSAKSRTRPTKPKPLPLPKRPPPLPPLPQPPPVTTTPTTTAPAATPPTSAP